MTAFGRFSLRLGLYLLVAAYLAGDLFVFNGPLNRHLRRSQPDSPEAIAAAKAKGVVARVYGYTITRSQLERAIHERLWLEGKSFDSLPPAEQKLVRYAALGDLIDHQIIRLKVSVNTRDLPVSQAEIDERMQHLLGRFESKEAMEAAMKTQGIPNERALRDRIAGRIQQEKYVESRVAPLVKVTEEETRKWHEENHERLARPEQVEARHIFLRTLNREPDEAKATLETALGELSAKTKDFPALAAELSEDPASKDQGGSLGWMSRDRLPDDFATAVFALKPGVPTLVRTTLGWHLVEITNHKPAGERTLEEAGPEIRAALEAAKRRQATREFRDTLRRFEAKHIEIFHDMLAD